MDRLRRQVDSLGSQANDDLALQLFQSSRRAGVRSTCSFKLAALMLLMCSTPGATGRDRDGDDRSTTFSDPDPLVQARIYLDRSGVTTVYPNSAAYPHVLPYAISSDIWSRQYLTMVATVGGLSSGECKRVPLWDEVAIWTRDNMFLGYNRQIPGRDVTYSLKSPSDIEANQRLLDRYELRKPGDATGIVGGKIWPRRGY